MLSGTLPPDIDQLAALTRTLASRLPESLSRQHISVDSVWELIRRAVQSGIDNEQRTMGERRLLMAAFHLLAMGVYIDEEVAGLSFPTFCARARVVPKVGENLAELMARSITARKAYAAIVLSGPAASRGTFAAGRTQAKKAAQLVSREVAELLASESALRDILGSVGADSSGESSNYWVARWGPEREMFTIDSGGSPFPTFNSISNNPNIGDERNFVGLRQLFPNSTAPNVWSKDVWGRLGSTFVMRIYINNSGHDNADIVPAGRIHGARLRVGLTSKPGEASVYAELSSVNAATVWDGATLHFETDAMAEFDNQYCHLENNAHQGGGIDLGGDIFVADGVLLGYEAMDGFVRPGYQYALYVTLRLRIVNRDSSRELIE